MFGDIKVKNFRGVRSSEISGLGHVNLFWGKNNCGKSTLLDSLFLISGLSNPQLPLSVNFFRDYIHVSEKDLSLNFYDLDTSSPIEISTVNEHVRSLVITLVSSVNVGVEIDSNHLGASDNLIQKKFGYRLDYTYDSRSYYSELIFNI